MARRTRSTLFGPLRADGRALVAYSDCQMRPTLISLRSPPANVLGSATATFGIADAVVTRRPRPRPNSWRCSGVRSSRGEGSASPYPPSKIRRGSPEHWPVSAVDYTGVTFPFATERTREP